MSDLKVLKVKLIKKGEEVFILTKEAGDHQRNVSNDCKDVPHEDFLKAVSALRPHLMALSGWCKASEAYNHEDLGLFTVTGYSLGGKEGSEGIIITGYRSCDWGTVGNNTPFIRLEQAEDKEYQYLEDLLKDVSRIEQEALLYLQDGKRMPERQTSLEFPEDQITKAVVAAPATPEDHAAAFVKEQNEKIEKAKLQSVPRGKTDADPEAQARVSQWDHEAENADGSPKNKAKAAANKAANKRKVAQSATHPSGEAE